jgi:hypothetical protein
MYESFFSVTTNTLAWISHKTVTTNLQMGFEFNSATQMGYAEEIYPGQMRRYPAKRRAERFRPLKMLPDWCSWKMLPTKPFLGWFPTENSTLHPSDDRAYCCARSVYIGVYDCSSCVGAGWRFRPVLLPRCGEGAGSIRRCR